MSTFERVFLVACGLAAIVAAGLLFALGDTRGSVAAVIVALSVLTLLGSRSGTTRSPQRIWLGLGLLAIGLTILGFSIAVVAGALLALFALQLVANVVVARNVGRIRLEPLDHPAVMPGAEISCSDFPRRASVPSVRTAFESPDGRSS